MLKLLPILFTFSLFGQELSFEHQLLWEISGNNLSKKSYLFGSLHSNDRRVFNLTDSTYLALNQADVIVLETDIFSMFPTLDTRDNSPEILIDRLGVPYSSELSATKTIYGDEDGMPQFLDAFFQQYCYNTGKDFFALETVEFQQRVNPEMKSIIKSGVYLPKLLSTKDDLIDLYIKGDIYDLDEFLKVSLSLYDEGYNQLITDRNIGMRDKLDAHLKESEKSLFCAVGAGHLAGEKGLIKLLRKRGYLVRQVQATYTDNFGEKTKIYKSMSHVFSDEELNFSAVFPGHPNIEKVNIDEQKKKIIYRDLGQGNTYEIEVYLRNKDAGLKELAEMYIASPENSPSYNIVLDDGGEAYEGISDSYPEGFSWTRIIMNEEYFLILKAYGGNKFMNSKRAMSFFENVWFD